MVVRIVERPSPLGKHHNIKFRENYKLSSSHWYGFLPRRWQSKLVEIGIKLGIVRRFGYMQIIVDHPDGTFDVVHGYNILPDTAIKHLGDILANVNTTETDLAFMEPGSGTTTPAITDTDTETPLTPADRLAVTQVTRGTATPFEVVAETFISSTKYTRPQTINELVVFFEPDETGDIFARGVLGTGIILNANDTATINYSFVFR